MTLYDDLAAYLASWGGAPFPLPAHGMVPLRHPGAMDHGPAGTVPLTFRPVDPEPTPLPRLPLTQHQRVQRWGLACVLLGLLGLVACAASVVQPWWLVPGGLLVLASYGAGAMAEDAAWLRSIGRP